MVTAKGEMYRSFSAACMAHGLHHTAVKREMAKSSCAIDEAIDFLLSRGVNKAPACRENKNITMSPIYGYDEAKQVYCDPNGNEYNSFRQMCLANKMEPSTVSCRIKRGDTLIKALSNSRNFQPIFMIDTSGNVECLSKTSVAKEASDNCRKDQTFNTKVFLGELDQLGNIVLKNQIDNAIDSATKDKNTIEINGISYIDTPEELKPLYDSISKKNVSLVTFVKRLRSGMTPEEAAVVAPRTMRMKLPPVVLKRWNWDENKLMFIAPNGEVYRSRSQMCNAYGVDMGIVTRRLAYGATLEEALSSKRISRIKPHDKSADLTSMGYDSETDSWSIDGKHYYNSMRQMCHAHNVSSTWWKIGKEYNIDTQILLDRAAEFPIKGAQGIARQHGTASGTIARYMLINNCSFEVALEAVKKS